MSLKIAAIGLALGLAISAQQAHANLIISVNGTQEATDPTNTFATFTGAVGSFNLNTISMVGLSAFGGNGTLVDNGSLNISTSGAGTLNIKLTETNLAGASTIPFSGLFTGTMTNATVSRSFYVDPTNAGLMTTLLGSTTTSGGSFFDSVHLSGPYSLTEYISITATGPGATLSADDTVKAPEPISLSVLGFGLLGLGMVRHRRHKRQG
ncbi:MAG TPA: hypothetical protein VFL55_04410 [Acetobacteraceae bacterium]|nr:hypothetical protein [Acetobacteraceae bacterium]